MIRSAWSPSAATISILCVNAAAWGGQIGGAGRRDRRRRNPIGSDRGEIRYVKIGAMAGRALVAAVRAHAAEKVFVKRASSASRASQKAQPRGLNDADDEVDAVRTKDFLACAHDRSPGPRGSVAPAMRRPPSLAPDGSERHGGVAPAKWPASCRRRTGGGSSPRRAPAASIVGRCPPWPPDAPCGRRDGRPTRIYRRDHRRGRLMLVARRGEPRSRGHARTRRSPTRGPLGRGTGG